MSITKNYIIGTRGSDLALWQANYVKDELFKNGINCELKIIATAGDISQQWNTSFEKLDGKGFFTKELEQALLNKEIDLAVHSHKDLPTTMPPGLAIAAVTTRHDPSELLLIRKQSTDTNNLWHLKNNAIIGTSSARRKTQILLYKKDASIKDLRGNVPTRIQKLRDGQYDAILIAAAGVERLNLNLNDLTVVKLQPKEFIPAPAQGVLALQVRENDNTIIADLQILHNADTANEIKYERKLLNLFDGGCLLPLGAYCLYNKENKIYSLYISHAPKANVAAKPFVAISDYLDLQNIKNKILLNNIASIFISKNIEDAMLFSNYCNDNNINLNANSLIKTKAINFDIIEPYHWLFFSSKNAVEYFFEKNKTISNNIKIGAIGSSTAKLIMQLGYTCSFIGSNTDFNIVGEEFFALVKDTETIIFPQAKASNKTIQYNKNAVGFLIDLIVYETELIQKEVPEQDAYVFTSPSNVTSFFKYNTINKTKKIIAIGNATKECLLKHNIPNNSISLPNYFDDWSLLAAVFN